MGQTPWEVVISSPSPLPGRNTSRNTKRLSLSLPLYFTKLISLCVLMTFSLEAASQNFGKLFTTPEERQYLDGLRENFLQRTELEGFNISEQFKPLLESTAPDQNVEFELSGFMKRRNGGKAVWLNGKALNENELPQNVTIVSRKGLEMLRFVVQKNVHYIKAGQTLNIETGHVRESFESPETALNGLTASIPGSFQGDEETNNKETTKPANSKTKDSVDNDDLIEALQAIQEAKDE